MTHTLDTKEVKKTLYQVIGTTRSCKYVSSGWGSDELSALEAFVTKHPRFAGQARLESFEAVDKGNGILLRRYGEDSTKGIAEYTSAKEIKALIK